MQHLWASPAQESSSSFPDCIRGKNHSSGYFGHTVRALSEHSREVKTLGSKGKARKRKQRLIRELVAVTLPLRPMILCESDVALLGPASSFHKGRKDVSPLLQGRCLSCWAWSVLLGFKKLPIPLAANILCSHYCFWAHPTEPKGI